MYLCWIYPSGIVNEVQFLKICTSVQILSLIKRLRSLLIRNWAYFFFIRLVFSLILAVVGDTGIMGGTHSHEYHYPAKIGDDSFKVCCDCNASWNVNVVDEKNVNASICKECGSPNLKIHKGIEVRIHWIRIHFFKFIIFILELGLMFITSLSSLKISYVALSGLLILSVMYFVKM